MTLSVEQGNAIRLPAEFFAGEVPADPADPLVSVFDPSNVAVVSSAVPVRDGVGVYHYDYPVALDAPLGTWRARWTATIDEAEVGGEDEFEVLAPTVVSDTATTPDAAEIVSESTEEKELKPARSKAKLVAWLFVGALILAGTVLLLITRTREPEPLSVQEALREGLAAQRAGNTEEARERYQDVLKSDPENKYAHFDLGIIEQVEGNTQEAKERYERALASDPNFLSAMFNLAIAHETLGENNRAAELYRRIIAFDPNHSAAHLNLGFLLTRKLGNQAEGEAQLRRAVELNPRLAARLPENLRQGPAVPSQP